MSDTILRLPAVCARTGLRKSTIYAMIRAREFPAAIPLHKRAVGWPASLVDRWVDERKARAEVRA